MTTTRRAFLRRTALAGAGVLTAAPWLQERRPGSTPRWVHDISLSSPDFDDLRFLTPLLSNARIVQLGENGHGAAQSMQLRARIAAFLCEALGFSVLAFESSLFLCHMANVEARQDSRRMLTSSLIGVWHTEEMLPLFERISRSQGSGRPLQLAGFDVQPIGAGRRRRPAFFGEVAGSIDADYGRAVAALDTEFLDAYDKGSRPRRAYFREHGARLSAGYERLAAFLDGRMGDLERAVGRAAPLVARQEALSMAVYVRYQSAADMRSYAEGRDEGMFRNLKFLAEELFPSQKIVVWGHNYHLRHDNAAIPPTEAIFPGVTARSMGTWTRQHFGEAVLTIGQYEAVGTALDNARKPYTIEVPAEGTFEGRLHALSDAPAFINLHAASGTKDGAWVETAVPARYNGQHPETLVPARQYDAVLMLPSVSPPHFLY
jgi:erythromycin esterase